MSEESVNQGGKADPELGLATPEILETWLAYDSMSLWDAALIAHGASPDAGGLGLNAGRREAVEGTYDILVRSAQLEPVKVKEDQELYKTSEVFQVLASKGHRFPVMVKEILLKKRHIRSGTQVRSVRHGNTERYESDRIQVMHAMIRVLADPNLQTTCRKNGAADGPVVGVDLARTIDANRQALFDSGKSPRKTETIAKLFNEIVRPQIR